MAASDNVNCQRVFKKSSPNNKVTLYLCSRDLVIENGVIDKLQGVLCVDQDVLDSNKKVFGQVTLTFRYGREDEEVMGLKFCNEAVMCLAQIFPAIQGSFGGLQEPNTPLQDALLQRLGPRAHAFSMELTPLAPPSVQLVPAKEYRGAPIGTSYDVRAFVEGVDSKLEKRSTVRMGIRVVQGGGFDMHSAALTPTRDSRFMRLSPKNLKAIASPNRRTSPQNLRPPALPEESTLGDDISSEKDSRGKLSPIQTTPAPHALVEKPFLLSEGRVILEGCLEKSSYSHGEPIKVTVTINNSSHKTVRRVKVFVVQHVDVCMFSNGKFKNMVAVTQSKDDSPINPGGVHTATYVLKPARGNTKNWIALEDSYNKSGASLASTVLCQSNSPDDRNVFAIYVSYYVKIKITMSAMGGELSIKLPFTLQHSCREDDPLSPNCNMIHGGVITDDIIAEDTIEKCKNITELQQIKPFKSDKFTESLEIENITPSEDVGPTKIIVTVEDHQRQNEESYKRKIERMMKDKCNTRISQDEDFNMISNYDEEDT